MNDEIRTVVYCGSASRVDVHATSSGSLTVTVGPLTLVVDAGVWERLIDTSRPALATLRRQRLAEGAVALAEARTRHPAGRLLESSAQLDWDDQHRGKHRGPFGFPEYVENTLPPPKGRHRSGMTYIGGKPGGAS